MKTQKTNRLFRIILLISILISFSASSQNNDKIVATKLPMEIKYFEHENSIAIQTFDISNEICTIQILNIDGEVLLTKKTLIRKEGSVIVSLDGLKFSEKYTVKLTSETIILTSVFSTKNK
jgi:hypothetical protein